MVCFTMEGRDRGFSMIEPGNCWEDGDVSFDTAAGEMFLTYDDGAVTEANEGAVEEVDGEGGRGSNDLCLEESCLSLRGDEETDPAVLCTDVATDFPRVMVVGTDEERPADVSVMNGGDKCVEYIAGGCVSDFETTD